MNLVSRGFKYLIRGKKVEGDARIEGIAELICQKRDFDPDNRNREFWTVKFIDDNSNNTYDRWVYPSDKFIGSIL